MGESANDGSISIVNGDGMKNEEKASSPTVAQEIGSRDAPDDNIMLFFGDILADNDEEKPRPNEPAIISMGQLLAKVSANNDEEETKRKDDDEIQIVYERLKGTKSHLESLALLEERNGSAFQTPPTVNWNNLPSGQQPLVPPRNCFQHTLPPSLFKSRLIQQLPLNMNHKLEQLP